MKKIFLICFSVLSLAITAQDRPAFISLAAGPSFPVGGYKGTEKLTEDGFALTGFNINLEGAWYFLPWMGIGASSGLTINPVDAETLGNGYLESSEFLDKLVIRSDPYLSLAFYPGLFFRFPLAEKISLTAKATAGLMYSRTPYQLFKAEYYLIGKNWFEVTSAGDYEFSFMAGAGVSYDLTDRIGLLLQGDFTYNEMDFTFLTSGDVERTDLKVFSWINLTGGILVRLGKQ
jgi:hypothetical protein